MSKLANMFSALHLDAEDDGEDGIAEAAQASSSIEATAAGKRDKNRQNGIIAVNYDERTLISSGDFKMPLVWIDLEMTGLDITKDRILEIACIITDGKLTKQIEGPDLVISQSKDCLDNMGEWCKTHHAASGLTERVLQSELSERDAESQKYMPQLAAIFSHVIVDVSSIMALCIRWYPKERKQTPRKRKTHRAMDDIKESIAELKYYKDNIFKPQKFKR
ncbi:oligoribonuclease-like isoform X3 [Phragmites australis]|uniref:oligoribonuclease-like isoform X3 n=1 Tax=Phragmites australis TaxID=29695 RepID=UPI002D7A3069|nr:oligoribonuclease-like isoform X3 [Phragmites australis]